MKLIGNLLLTICIITGCLSAATAYLAPVGSGGLEGLTTSEDAGVVPLNDARRERLASHYSSGTISAEQYVQTLDHQTPIIEKGSELTGKDLTDLADAKVTYVNVKTFSASRWPHAWVFGLSAAGLLAGSLLVRAGDKAAIAKQQPAEGAESHAGSPDAAMKAISDALVRLKADLPGMASDEARLRAVIENLGELQADAIPTFIEARPQLIARFGLGKFAEIMDRFAAMERKINRSWSAAADGHWPESSAALDDAVAIAPEVSAKL